MGDGGFSGQCGDDFQHQPLAGEAREGIVEANLLRQAIAEMPKDRRPIVWCAIEHEPAVCQILDPSCLQSEMDLAHSSRAELLSVRQTRWKEGNVTACVVALGTANPFLEASLHDYAQQHLIVLVWQH